MSGNVQVILQGKNQVDCTRKSYFFPSSNLNHILMEMLIERNYWRFSPIYCSKWDYHHFRVLQLSVLGELRDTVDLHRASGR